MLEKWSIVWCNGTAGNRNKHGVMPAYSGLCSFGIWGPDETWNLHSHQVAATADLSQEFHYDSSKSTCCKEKIAGDSKTIFSSPQYCLGVLIRLDLLLIGKKKIQLFNILCSHIFVYAVPSPTLSKIVICNVLTLDIWCHGVLSPCFIYLMQKGLYI